MRDLSVVVENLRLVQRARRRFMELWTVEKDYINPVLDRMADDLESAAAAAARDVDDDDPRLNPPGTSDEDR